MAPETKLIKNTNINIVYEGLDHRFINSGEFKTLPNLEKDNYGSTVIESYSPPFKRLVLPQSRATIVIDAERAVISDDSGHVPEGSRLVNVLLRNVANLLKKFQSLKYGFNYVVSFRPQGLKLDERILCPKFLRLAAGDLLSIGGRMVFDADGVRQDLRVERVGPDEFIASLNAHYEKPIFDGKEDLSTAVKRWQTEFESNYEKLVKIIDKI